MFHADELVYRTHNIVYTFTRGARGAFILGTMAIHGGVVLDERTDRERLRTRTRSRRNTGGDTRRGFSSPHGHLICNTGIVTGSVRRDVAEVHSSVNTFVRRIDSGFSFTIYLYTG